MIDLDQTTYSGTDRGVRQEKIAVERQRSCGDKRDWLENLGRGPQPDPSMLNKSGDKTADEEWPTIEQGARLNRGHARRLTMIPNRLSTLIANNNEYQPTTKGGKQAMKCQIAGDIKKHLF